MVLDAVDCARADIVRCITEKRSLLEIPRMLKAKQEQETVERQKMQYFVFYSKNGNCHLHPMVTLLLVVSFYFVNLVQCQVFYPGECTEQTVVQNFDVPRYLGLWYENRNYIAFFQVKQLCVTATYTQLPNETDIVRVVNSGIQLGSASDIEGQAELVNPNRNEAKLRVSFPDNFFSSAFADPTDDGNYWVLDTDYDNYAVVWTCREQLGALNSQYLWVLTRERYPSLETLSKALTAIETRGLDTNALVITEQTDCLTV